MLNRRLAAVAAAFAMVLGACAPGATVVPVTPEAPQRPDQAVVPFALPVVETSPDRWWMLDPETDAVAGAAVDRAYRELLAGRAPTRTVVVAIIDSGVEVEHDDLRSVMWRNPGEQPGTGRDDDGNGYVDDYHGWNFIGGADGRHVDDDTYEVTRLFAACSARFGDVDPASPPAAAAERAAFDECVGIAYAYHEKRDETEEMLAQLTQMDQAVTMIWSILRAEVGQDLTVESVRALRPTRPDVMQAREVYLNLAEHSITPEIIRDELDRLQRLLEFGLDPAFDPRHIVGDNYADVTERFYGNPDVTGPDAAHGTGVAGIVGAVRGNGSRVDGIAPNVRIMAVRAVPNGDERDKDVANAIRYAVDNGADIINMSFGKAFSPQKAAVDDAVRYADSRGVLLVHAAGNDGRDLTTEPSFPSRFYLDGDTARLWLEIGASSWRGGEDLAANFSNYGAGHVHVFAPGVDILSTTTGNDYSAASGTSFAAPVVTGLAALLLSYFPELSAAEVKRIILDSATPLGDHIVQLPGDDETSDRFARLSATGGIVNAFRAVEMALGLAAGRQ
jgi:subtilisin family serine protease